jgi:hypothetical protein
MVTGYCDEQVRVRHNRSHGVVNALQKRFFSNRVKIMGADIGCLQVDEHQVVLLQQAKGEIDFSLYIGIGKGGETCPGIDRIP